MEEIIAIIFEITKDMDRALKEANEQEFSYLLNKRQEFMEKVDKHRAENPIEPYSSTSSQLLAAALEMDQRMAIILNNRLLETQASLNQLKKKKKVSQKYQPYVNQTNGVFVDSKK